MKKESEISQLLRFAGKHKILTISSWILAAASAILTLVPLVYNWKILDEVFRVAPNFTGATNITYYGWVSVLFAFVSMLVYISALMCSHLAAFRIAKNMRKNIMEHITTLPLGSWMTLEAEKCVRLLTNPVRQRKDTLRISSLTIMLQ